MKIFLDSCDLQAIQHFSEMGLVDGVTTNPSIVAASGVDFKHALQDMCAVVKTSVSAEVMATTTAEMLAEAELYCSIGSQITIKLPMNKEGLRAGRILVERGVSVNMTLCFSAAQALLAAKIGAEYVSPFIGRLDDSGQDGMQLLADICDIYRNYPNIRTKIIVASVRNINHVISAAKLGADIVTITPKLLNSLMHHDLTSKGLEIFANDWKKAGQKV